MRLCRLMSLKTSSRRSLQRDVQPETRSSLPSSYAPGTNHVPGRGWYRGPRVFRHDCETPTAVSHDRLRRSRAVQRGVFDSANAERAQSTSDGCDADVAFTSLARVVTH